MKPQSNPWKPWSPTIGALAVALLAACGGSSPTEPTDLSLQSTAEMESVTYSLVNQSRNEQALDGLGLDAVVQEIARQHSQAMRDLNFLGHVGPDGRTLRDRLAAAGISYRRAAENVGWVDAHGNPAFRIHQDFLASPHHRDNILGPSWRLVGVGVARSDDRIWVTEVFVEP